MILFFFWGARAISVIVAVRWRSNPARTPLLCPISGVYFHWICSHPASADAGCEYPFIMLILAMVHCPWIDSAAPPFPGAHFLISLLSFHLLLGRANTFVVANLSACTLMGSTPTDDARLMSDVASRVAFNILSMGPTLLGLPLFLLAIVFGKNVAKRGAIFLNFIVAVILMGLSFGLLPLIGEQDQLHPRSRTLCFVQAALVDGALAMTPVSILALVLQLGMGLCLFDRPEDLNSHLCTAFDIILIALPYMSFLVFGLRDILEFSRILFSPPGSLDIEIVNAAFYCTIATPQPFSPIAAAETPLILFIVGVSSATLLVECYIAFMLWRRWSSLRAAGNKGVTAILVRSLVRLTLLTVYRVVIIAIAISVVEEPRIFSVAAFLHGAIPLVVFFIFALQQDIIDAWLHWLRALAHPFVCIGGRMKRSPSSASLIEKSSSGSLSVTSTRTASTRKLQKARSEFGFNV